MHYFVRSNPMPLVVGGFSVGTHVFTEQPYRAREVATELGYEPLEVIPCPDMFSCTCVADARRLLLGRE